MLHYHDDGRLYWAWEQTCHNDWRAPLRSSPSHALASSFAQLPLTELYSWATMGGALRYMRKHQFGGNV